VARYPHGMRFGLLGPLAVWTEEGTPVAVPGAKVRALLADLLIHAGEPVSADRLVDDLWEGDPPANPIGALQSKVSQLRRALEQAEPGARELLVSRPSGYLLQVAAEAVDAGRFAAVAARAREQGSPRAAAALLAEALAIWRGPALADHAEDGFARGAVVRLEEQRVAALEDWAEARLALGEHGALIGELAELVARYPLRERLHAAHLRALYRAGRQAEALESYRQLRARLVEDLGVDPGPDLTRLHQAILNQDPALDGPAPQERPARPRTNVPAPLTSLVGRAAAIAEVRKLLDTGRLVTLTGPGGVGKTRLALEIATQLVEDLPDGSWTVELAGRGDLVAADTVARLAEHVAVALGVRDDAALASFPAGPHTGMLDRLAAALHTKRLLLVLDNCERAIAPVAELAALLLRSAPGLQVLATSREPLGLTGELLWPVPPLEVPVGEGLDALGRSSAVQLFVERAAAATPGFAVGAGNAAAVASICRRLDGLPLALELAAARIRALGVDQLAARLDDRFRVLATGGRDAPARQQTLRAVIDWSWELLSAGERAVLRRLAVHVDGFTLAAAEAASAGGEVDAADVLDLLARLVDRSLVVAEPTTTGTRYRLLETVAAYGLERLDEAEETAPTRQRHALYYVALAEEAEAHLRGHDQQGWLERLDAETANLHAALNWTVEQHDAGMALRLVGALTWYWFLRGRHREGQRRLATALAVAGEQPVAARAKALVWLSALSSREHPSTDPMQAGRAALELYDGINEPAALAHAQWLLGFATVDLRKTPVGMTLVEEALVAFRRLGDRWGLAAALSVQGWDALRRGDLNDARRTGQESHALFRALGDRWGQVRTANLLGVLAEITGDHQQATRLHRDGLRLAEELGLWPVAAEQLGRLGRLAVLAGDYPAADDYHQRSLRLGRDQAFDRAVTFARIGLGISARRQGWLAAAEQHLRLALDAHRADGYLPGLAFVLAELGFVAELRGDALHARALHLDGLAAARENGDPRAVALALEGLAGVATLAADHTEAARLLGIAAAARASVGAPLPPAERGDIDRIAATARAALGDDGFAAGFRRGNTMSLDDALATRPDAAIPPGPGSARPAR
jgi:predicted ATPase/DNA-binding SARP family transcriptional activator